MTTYVQKGESLDYKNGTGTLIKAGEVAVLGNRAGVAGVDIPPGGTGSIHMSGVFQVQKKQGEAISAGEDIYYSEEGVTGIRTNADAASETGTAKAGEAATAGSNGGNLPLLGYAAMDAAAEDVYATVKLLG